MKPEYEIKNTMKKILLAFTMLLAMVACTNKPARQLRTMKKAAWKQTISLPLTAIWQTPSVAAMQRANTAYLSTAS